MTRGVCVGVCVLQLTVPYVVDVLIQVTLGVHHMHACLICHNDLRCDNMLIHALSPLTIKVAGYDHATRSAPIVSADDDST